MTQYEGLPTEDTEAEMGNTKDIVKDADHVMCIDRPTASLDSEKCGSVETSLPHRSTSKTKINFPGSRGNLYYAVLAASLGSVALGTHYSWTSPTLPVLQGDNSSLPLTNEEASWVVSLTLFGTMLGPFVGGWFVNVIGRRGTIFLGVVFGCVSWVILMISSEVWHLYVGRYIGGLGGGIEFLACPMYTAEISEPAVRGALGSVFAFFLMGGYLICYLVGPFVSYSMLILVCLVPSALFFLLIPLVPESPYYYLRRGESAKALESLTWLRSSKAPAEVQMEIDEIKKELIKSMKERATVSDLVATRGSRLALVHSLVIVIAQSLSGIDVILSYAEKIFIMAGTSFSSSASAIIIGLMTFIAAGFGGPLAKMFGIKNVLVGSGIGCAVFQVAFGCFFYFQETGCDMSSYGLVPILSMVGFISFFIPGFGVLAWAVVAELFPSKAKPLGPAICTFVNKLAAFVLIKFFLIVADSVGTYVTFFFFAGCCLCAGLYVLFLLPDLRGMTLQEIQDTLEGRKYRMSECDPHDHLEKI